MLHTPRPSLLLPLTLALLGATLPARAGDDAADRGTLILVHAAHLEAAAHQWADYRSRHGWTVRTEAVPPAVSEQQRETVRQRIAAHADAHGSDPGRPLAVLILGDADDRGIATWSFPQDDPMLASPFDPRQRTFVSDDPYQHLDGDDLPDIALGRIPARTTDEALTVLEKVRRYEQGAPRGPWRRRVNYTAGEGRYGAVDLLLEHMFKSMVERLVPEAYDLTMTYAKATSIYCPPPTELTSTILRRLGEGSLLFNYVGHGWEGGFDHLVASGQRLPMLNTEDLERLETDGNRLPLALLTCCSAGWFDLEDGSHSLAEAMLFHPAGPVAVIAGSRLTHPYANTVLQKDVTNLLLVQRVETVGELDRLAMRSMLRIDRLDRELDRLARPLAAAGGWKSTLGDLRRMHVRLYNLLGDPALRIAHPAETLRELEVAEGRVHGRVPGMVRGSALITIECGQVEMTRPGGLRPVLDDADPAFPEKAANNYALANDRVFARLETPVQDERFTARLPDGLPAGAVIIKAYVSGEDEAGRPLDAFGADRLD